MSPSSRLLIAVAATAIVSATVGCARSDGVRLDDASDGRNWPGYGRTYGEQHFSPLKEIDAQTVGKLGLAWSMDLGAGNSVTAPAAVDGVLYFATGPSVMHAVDAVTGKLLWVYDPEAGEKAGHKMRVGFGTRGVAWWNGKVYTGTADGRLIAVDAKTGKLVWSAMTVPVDDTRTITGAPRIFEGKVIVGHAGADTGDIRGYVTTYDAETGKQLWRFYLVPGNPADGFENKAMEMAAKTWSGEWWKYGGGGTVWNAISYDAETDTVFLGTGNGAPWNHKIRSEGKGDNLFLCSIVALDGKTGAYKWHYQINPGETWDYNAAMDMELADLVIDGKPRKALLTAPKNGFFYVLDRTNGRLISAQPFARVTWASRIDLATGRPVENPGARFPDGKPFTMFPGPTGAHSWHPMAFSPQSGLAYIPVQDTVTTLTDKGLTRETWVRAPGFALDGGIGEAPTPGPLPADANTSSLLAWNPVTQEAAWRVPTPAMFNGGVLATGGNLVFQGRLDGKFNAHDARNGKLLWSFDAQAPVTAPPISYEANGHQYVTVLTGVSGMSSASGAQAVALGADARTPRKRVLTFRIGGEARLPDKLVLPMTRPDDPTYRADPVAQKRGEALFGRHCLSCHGIDAISGGYAPDLRLSGTPQSAEAFDAVVHQGALVGGGMPRFDELTVGQRTDIRQYVRAQARKLPQ